MIDDISFLHYLIPGIAFGFAAAAQPGPLMLYFISRTLQSGWKKTFPAVFAPVVTDGPIAIACLLILGSLPPYFLLYIQVAGGLFILYLAYRAAKTWKGYSGGIMVEDHSSRRTLLDAIVVNFLNSGPWIGWSLVIGPLFLEGWKGNPVNGILLLAGFYITMFLVSTMVIVLFHQARDRGPKFQRILLGLSVIFLAIFGIYQLVSAGIKLM